MCAVVARGVVPSALWKAVYVGDVCVQVYADSVCAQLSVKYFDPSE